MLYMSVVTSFLGLPGLARVFSLNPVEVAGVVFLQPKQAVTECGMHIHGVS